MKKKIGIIQHGCAKNLVDVELMAGYLVQNGYEITLDPLSDDDCKIVVVNTCSFIHDAEKESVQSILGVAAAGKKIIVTGCLPQKHSGDLIAAIPEIQAMLGTSDFDKIIEAVKAVENDEGDARVQYEKINKNPSYRYPEHVERSQITVGASSYIKIADGCNYSCGYCIIPKLRGKYTSRKPEDILKEAKTLADKGVGEIILIAQDTTSYGVDLESESEKKPNLAALLRELNKIENLNWIRVLYTYPTNFDDELIDAFATLDKVVKYIDMPLQHSHPDVLKKMNRPVVGKNGGHEELISKIRKKIPQVAIRTTFIVGYPTETQEQFEHLKKFIQKIKFDRLGVFEFSREKDTIADKLKPQIPARIKKRRKVELLEVQNEISNTINVGLIGKKIPCIIEEIHADSTVVARSYKDAPEVDGLVYIETKKHVNPCDIEMVEIVSHSAYDLFGKI